MGNTDGYFGEKKPWSKTKDALLRCYLTAYFQKVMTARRPIIYVDGFAGAGKFEDETYGSPIFALETMIHAQGKAKCHPPITFVCAETNPEYLASLKTAISERFPRFRNVKYFDSGYAAAVDATISASEEKGIFFFYIDPFGIVALDFQIFEDISARVEQDTSGAEVLLNFSSPGFLREACCVCAAQAAIPQDIGFAEEGFREHDTMQDRETRLDTIAGGHWWRDIVDRFRKGEISFWAAEEEVSKNYCANLGRLFDYVLDMPIRDKGGDGQVKYRMIHMTNHPDGCLLMNDNMLKRAQDVVVQGTLFEVDFNKTILEDRVAEIPGIAKTVIDEMPLGKEMLVADLAAKVISRVGVILRATELKTQAFSPFEQNGTIERVDKFTPTGKTKSGWSDPKMKIRRIGADLHLF